MSTLRGDASRPPKTVSHSSRNGAIYLHRDTYASSLYYNSTQVAGLSLAALLLCLFLPPSHPWCASWLLLQLHLPSASASACRGCICRVACAPASCIHNCCGEPPAAPKGSVCRAMCVAYASYFALARVAWATSQIWRVHPPRVADAPPSSTSLRIWGYLPSLAGASATPQMHPPVAPAPAFVAFGYFPYLAGASAAWQMHHSFALAPAFVAWGYLPYLAVASAAWQMHHFFSLAPAFVAWGCISSLAGASASWQMHPLPVFLPLWLRGATFHIWQVHLPRGGCTLLSLSLPPVSRGAAFHIWRVHLPHNIFSRGHVHAVWRSSAQYLFFLVPICYVLFGGCEHSAERQASLPREALPARDGAGTVQLDVSLASFEVSRPEVAASA